MEETTDVLTISKTCSTFEIWRCPLLLGKKWKTDSPGNFNPLLFLGGDCPHCQNTAATTCM